MKLFLISQDKNNGYDTYESAVVCAHDENNAKTIHPYKSISAPVTNSLNEYSTWTELDNVKVKYIGEAAEGLERGVIVASFNAG